ncbi:MAG TPA: type II secretion system F family protein [Tepidisphaeraceae bacterium]|nr:type II secretion system F family protein [Tepidisphaeraceae bacterium]
MDTVLIILIAIAVAAVIWAASYGLLNLLEARKRKLRQRLGTPERLAGAATTERSVRLIDLRETLPGMLGKLRPARLLQQRLAQVYPSVTLAQFAAISLLAALGSAAITWLVTDVPFFMFCTAACAAYLPAFVVMRKVDHWKRSVIRQLPDALDFLSRVLRAGQSFSTGLQMMSEELPNPLAREFRRCYDQHGLGQPIEDALREMAGRLESTDFAFFATAVILQRQSGGDLAEVLQNISHMIRQRLRLQLSVRAKTAEGRLTGYVMVLFPLVMFLITYAMDPVRGRVLLYTMPGRLLLLLAATLQLVGLLFIRRITTVRV